MRNQPPDLPSIARTRRSLNGSNLIMWNNKNVAGTARASTARCHGNRDSQQEQWKELH
jgi:hypothetical protein